MPTIKTADLHDEFGNPIAIPSDRVVDLNTRQTLDEFMQSRLQPGGGSVDNGDTRSYSKYVVVGIWGQSNAVGYDESPLTKYDVAKDVNRVFQFSDSLKPLTYCAENLQNMNTVAARNQTETNRMAAEREGEPAERLQYTKTKGVHLPLANLILGAIPDDYAVIIVPAAYGGRALSSFQKGANSGYYNQFLNRMKGALNLHEDNILAGIVWCQGENDCGTAGATYVSNLQTLITNINNDLSAYAKRTTRNTLTENDWYFYEWPCMYKDADTGGILPAMKEFFGNRYTEIPYDTPVNTATYTSGSPRAHYGQNTFRTVIAPRLFDVMQGNGAFLCNRHDANSRTVYETAELEHEVEQLREKDILLEATVTNLVNKVNALLAEKGEEPIDPTPVKSWRSIKDTDYIWMKENHGGSVVDGNTFQVARSTSAAGILFNADIEQIRFKVANTGQPAFTVVAFDEATGGHNAVFTCGTNYQSNGHFWKANSIGDAFNGMPGDAGQLSGAITSLEQAPIGSLMTLTKVSDTVIRVQINDGSPNELDITTRSSLVSGATVRFGFNNCWTNNGYYKVTDIEVFAY